MNFNIRFSLLCVLYFSDKKHLEQTILKSVGIPIEFILIDNSEDHEYWTQLELWRQLLLQRIESPIIIKLLRSQKNIGYGGGINLGAKYAKGKYLILTNPDMDLSPSFISELTRITDIREWGIISPKIYRHKDKTQIFCGFIDIRLYWPFALFLFYNYNEADNELSTRIYENFYAYGGFFIIKRQLFLKLHGFDPNYFMYTEEVDLCHRARLSGEKTIFYPKLVIFHNKEPSSQFALNQMLKNNLIFIGTFYSPWILLIQFCFSIFRILYDFHYHKQISSLIQYLRSLISGLTIGLIKKINLKK